MGAAGGEDGGVDSSSSSSTSQSSVSKRTEGWARASGESAQCPRTCRTPLRRGHGCGCGVWDTQTGAIPFVGGVRSGCGGLWLRRSWTVSLWWREWKKEKRVKGWLAQVKLLSGGEQTSRWARRPGLRLRIAAQSAPEQLSRYSGGSCRCIPTQRISLRVKSLLW
jgi:hypothetical protein